MHDSVTNGDIVTTGNESTSSPLPQEIVTYGNMTVSTRLKEIRKAGLTQQEVADVAGVNRSLISQIERYGKDITVETLESIATACGARLVLIREGEELGALRQDEQDIVRAWRDIRDDGAKRELLTRLLVCLPRLDAVVVAILRGSVDAACGSSASRAEATRGATERAG